jgi:hypothetical protein
MQATRTISSDSTATALLCNSLCVVFLLTVMVLTHFIYCFDDQYKAREIGLLKLAEERAALRVQVEAAKTRLRREHDEEVAALKRDFEVRVVDIAMRASRQALQRG